MDSMTTEAVGLANGTRVVSVAGSVDIATAGAFERALGAAPARLIVDLTNCEFVDSSATGPLVEAHKRLPIENRPLALVSAKEHILLVFEATGLDQLFAIYPTRTAALRGAGHVRVA